MDQYTHRQTIIDIQIAKEIESAPPQIDQSLYDFTGDHYIHIIICITVVISSTYIHWSFGCSRLLPFTIRNVSTQMTNIYPFYVLIPGPLSFTSLVS